MILMDQGKGVDKHNPVGISLKRERKRYPTHLVQRLNKKFSTCFFPQTHLLTHGPS